MFKFNVKVCLVILTRFCMFCSYTRPRYQVSVYRTIGSLLVFFFILCSFFHNVISISLFKLFHFKTIHFKNCPLLTGLAFQLSCSRFTQQCLCSLQLGPQSDLFFKNQVIFLASSLLAILPHKIHFISQSCKLYIV